MLFGSLGAFTTGLILVSFSECIRCKPVIGFSDDQSVVCMKTDYLINYSRLRKPKKKMSRVGFPATVGTH